VSKSVPCDVVQAGAAMTALDSVSGYRLTVPAGWQRVTTGDGSKESVDRLIRWQLRRHSGRDHVLAERSLRELMPRLVADAEGAGALDLYFYSEMIRGIPVTMSFVVSITYLGAMAAEADERDLASVAGFGAADAGFVDIGVGRCFRAVEHRAPSVGEYRSLVSAQLGVSVDLATMEPATPESRDAIALLRQEEAAGRVLPSTRVSYLVPVPASPGAFLLATFTCDDSALSRAQMFMFDAIVSTLTWESE